MKTMGKELLLETRQIQVLCYILSEAIECYPSRERQYLTGQKPNYSLDELKTLLNELKRQAEKGA